VPSSAGFLYISAVYEHAPMSSKWLLSGITREYPPARVLQIYLINSGSHSLPPAAKKERQITLS